MRGTAYKILFLGCILSFQACSIFKKTAIETTIPEGKVEVFEVPKPEDVVPVNPHGYTVASVRKTPCIGNCPVFTFQIFEDGTCAWQGKAHTARMGNWEALLPKDVLNKMWDKAASIDFFNLADYYPTNGDRFVELPTTYISVQTPFHPIKLVERNHFGPLALINFEAYLLEVAESLNWKESPIK